MTQENSHNLFVDFIKFFAALCIANTPFWILMSYYGGGPFLISLEVAICVIFLKSKHFFLTGLVVSWSIGFASIISHHYFLGLGDLPGYWDEFYGLKLRDFEGLGLIASQLFLACGASIYLLMRKFCYFIDGDPGTKLIRLCYVGILVFLDVMNGSSTLSSKDARTFSINIVASPVLELSQELVSFENLKHLPANTSAIEHKILLDWAKHNPQGNIIYVIVESWSRFSSEELNRFLSNTLSSGLETKYDIVRKNVVSTGSTTNAELRELCNLSGNYKSLSNEDGSACLPSKMNEIGYKTIGFHGYWGSFFGREKWWPKIGIKNSLFLDDFSDNNYERCGLVFTGICDRRLLKLAFLEKQSGGNFIYLLSLNSHAPVAPVKNDKRFVKMCADENISRQSCGIAHQIKLVFREANELLISEKEAHDLFVFVGDHPSFGQSDQTSNKSSLVPAIILFPTH